MLCGVSMERYNSGERSEIDFKNFQPLPQVWPHPKMLKITFFQICCMMSWEMAMERDRPVEHSEMVLKSFDLDHTLNAQNRITPGVVRP